VHERYRQMTDRQTDDRRTDDEFTFANEGGLTYLRENEVQSLLLKGKY